MNRTVWTFQTVNGREHIPCPLTQTWDAAIAFRDAVYRALGFKIFSIPVLLFTSTPPNQTILGMGDAAPGQGALRVRRPGGTLVGTGL